MKLVFIHGSGGFGGVWHKQLAHFKDADAITRPGHPEDKPLGSMEVVVDWLHNYISSRSYREIVLCGHSMGGGIALAYTLKYPDDVIGLVLADSTSRMGMPPAFYNDPEAFVNDIDGYLKRLKEQFKRLPVHERDSLIMRMLGVGTSGRLADMTAMRDFDVSGRLKEIKVPVQVIIGAEDAIPRASFERLVAGIPDARLEVIENAGHYVMLDQPDKFNRMLGEFLGSL
ncbi:MAG: alpha/beta hydrolase [Chloroflexota bacterium]